MKKCIYIGQNMGESKRRKAAMGDNYGKPVKRWEVYELLIHLIEDNYNDLLKVNSEGFAKHGKGVVMALYPETPTDAGIDGELFYLPKNKFFEAMEQTYPVSKYPKIIPGATMLLEVYDPAEYMVLGLLGGVKPFVTMLRTDTSPEELVETVKDQVQKEIAENN